MDVSAHARTLSKQYPYRSFRHAWTNSEKLSRFQIASPCFRDFLRIPSRRFDAERRARLEATQDIQTAAATHAAEIAASWKTALLWFPMSTIEVCEREPRNFQTQQASASGFRKACPSVSHPPERVYCAGCRVHCRYCTELGRLSLRVDSPPHLRTLVGFRSFRVCY